MGKSYIKHNRRKTWYLSPPPPHSLLAFQPILSGMNNDEGVLNALLKNLCWSAKKGGVPPTLIMKELFASATLLNKERTRDQNQQVGAK